MPGQLTEGDTVFTPQGLEHIRKVSKEIERVPTVQRVYSLATANTVEAIGSNSQTPHPNPLPASGERGHKQQPSLDPLPQGKGIWNQGRLHPLH